MHLLPLVIIVRLEHGPHVVVLLAILVKLPPRLCPLLLGCNDRRNETESCQPSRLQHCGVALMMVFLQTNNLCIAAHPWSEGIGIGRGPEHSQGVCAFSSHE
jgi:hypothetical protein